MVTNRQVAEYYEKCEADYRLVWDLDKSLAMHYGYWDKSTKTLRQALMNSNKFLAGLAKIKNTDVVLDAGCGVGGSSIFLAKTFGCSVIGITLSKKQVKTATENAKRNVVENRVKFEVADFTATNFKENNFDVIWAMESVCCCKNKSQFVNESFRILKKTGRLVVADYFSKRSFDDDEAKIVEKWLDGWSVNSIEKVKSFGNFMKKAGYEDINYEKMNGMIMKSAKRLYFYSFPGIPLWKLGKIVGLTDELRCKDAVSCYLQYKALKKGLWEYGIFHATK
ncbi:MAG TPA: methyltransferase domain-containing protein [Candidatus Nanoarchaeia archaeon]|nr:methyltransferase domain-containing protein [Candidatus Nanoarchaeia archaeon]